jgi:RNA polymerase sigma-70 factor (ECF subfamily)
MIKIIFNLKKHNSDNFKEIYELNFNYVYSFIFSRVAANKETAEDMVQETFVSAMKAWDSYKGNSSYKTWLCGIAKNIIFNFYRSNKEKDSFYYEEVIEKVKDFQNVEFIIINSESRNIIFKTLNNLKPVYRYVLILKYMDDYSVKEVSECLCKTPKSIDGILQRAKNSFKEEYMKISGDELNEKRR